MNIIAIVQARMSSTRLPGKVMRLVNLDTPLIDILLYRLSQSKNINKIVLATSTNSADKVLVDHVSKLGFDVFTGSENDVLDRYYCAAKKYSADIVVRITGDCPLVDPNLVDSIIDMYKSISVDYVSNTITPTYPDGLDVEVFSFLSLESAWNVATSKSDREHVTPYIKKSGKYTTENFYNDKDYSFERWTVDEMDDYEVIRSIFSIMNPCVDFSWKEVLSLKSKHKSIFSKNKHLCRNEGFTMNTGQKLYKRAKKVIPGGNMLLSKRPEMFLPKGWPAYFEKSKGCKIWDLDGTEFIDMSIMGIGTNILGYGHPEVDDSVVKTVKNGNMSTFNCPEEVYLAEKLINMHPWADMVRFARTGGEINSIAIRIARAYTGKDKIAICGYHGWHDWYLSTNISSNMNLDSHLLPGLNPEGVPKALEGTTIPFLYNNIEQLQKIIKENGGDIAAIMMEVSRNYKPKDDYLTKVRDLATENNIILIFDECTSGFRETFGGLHKKYKVNPDMAIFAKALGNGYAISACIGRQKFMQSAQNTFISSTFWTERIGPTAALKTLEIMERDKSWETITKTGIEISSRWEKLSKKHGLSISTWGLPALSGYTFNSTNALAYKTLVTQEMLKNGYLATNSVYSCINHTQNVVDEYFENLDPIFATIKECEDGRSIKSLLDGPVCHSNFTRLN